MSDTIFTVIIPTFNTGELLKKTLDSLVAQTFESFEVIVSDDGSSDNTISIAKSYSDKLDLKIIEKNNWGGPARPRNEALKVALGKWIAFLDHDDFWYPMKLSMIVPYLDSADVIYHDLDIYTDGIKTQRKIRGRKLNGESFADMMMRGNPIPNSSSVVRKECLNLVKGVSEERDLITLEDFDLWIRLALEKVSFYYINTSLGGYRLEVGKNMTAPSLKQVERYNFLFQRYKNLLSDKEVFYSEAHFEYSKARAYHHLSHKENGVCSYQKSLSAKRLDIKLKSLIGLIILKFFK
jgi:glycosyltransferase involved in cell wall biosynthesis